MLIPPIAVLCFAVSLVGYGIDKSALPEWGKALSGVLAAITLLIGCFVL